jgi:3-dehydroquinate synthase
MRTIDLQTRTECCRIIIGGHLKDAGNLIPPGRMAVITDHRVSHLYRSQFPEGLIIEIEPGEKSKTLETASDIYGKLLDFELDRKDFILAVGGGVVCDVAGFVASTYMRGIRFGFAASTLLAQVDAGIGGKNGVNLKGYKNIVGVIRQPEFVICDLNMLDTLERKEYVAGIAEVIKYGEIMDKDMFDYCESHFGELLEKDPVVLEELVFRSVKNKCVLVGEDEYETGARMKLNFGHTFAHSLEKITGITHGEAVAVGMNLASAISVKEGFLSAEEATRLKSLIQSTGLPVTMEVNPDDLFQAIRKDKKKRGSGIKLILLEGIGKSIIHFMNIDDIKGILNDLYCFGT